MTIPADPLRNLGPADILRADARALPLADDSVDLIVTSPPYFALRSYRDADTHYSGQLGSEPTPAEFVDALVACTREMVRVLKPCGSIWLNLGDKFSTGLYSHDSIRNVPQPDGEWSKTGQRGRPNLQPSRQEPGVPPKSLLGIPWRFALRCIDDLGLILRQEQIWSKPNGLPESVTDRTRRSHEQWFHFTLSPRYYSAVDEIREIAEARKGAMTWAERRAAGEPMRRGEQGANDATVNGMMPNPLGKLPGSVWSIPTEPLNVPDHISHALCCNGVKRDGCDQGVDHFAAFPSEWPKRIIRGWSPPGVCVECGQGRRPVVDKQYEQRSPNDGTGRGYLKGDSSAWTTEGGRAAFQEFRLGRAAQQATITGYACDCPTPTAPTTPAVVLDPFGGTGTVAMVARALGRHGIHADLSNDYNRTIARWRITNLDQLAHVQGHERTKRRADTEQAPTLLDVIGDLA